MKKVDIIIPVYIPNDEAFGIVKNCIHSVLEHTLSPHRLLLVDDCSPLIGASDYLKSIPEQNPDRDISYIGNEENLGFIKTVNRGMNESSDRDVLLLNNDTIVTTGWLSRMVTCAYSNERIGTVTPFSNAATVFSIPESQESPLPEGYSPEDMAKVVYKYSPGSYPEIPTAHGFCMFIKRRLLQKLGLFDEVNYGRAYGEENDFSSRCIINGFYNVLDDRTFVYHVGEVSHQGSKSMVTDKNTETLNRIHPFYTEKVNSWVNSNPLASHRKIFQSIIKRGEIPEVDLASELPEQNSKKRNILHILHMLGGGTLKFVYDLVDNLDEDYNHFLLCSNGENISLFYDKKLILNFKLSSPLTWNQTISSKEYSDIFEKVIKFLSPAFVQVNSFIGHTFDAVTISKKYNVPTAYVMHDYNLVCPSNHLFNSEFYFCGLCTFGAEDRDCLKKNVNLFGGNLTGEYLHSYRTAINENIFQNVDFFIAPSNAVLDIFKKVYRDIPHEKLRVIPHGSVQHKPPEKDRPPQKYLHVGILGDMVEVKGSRAIGEVVQKTNSASMRFSHYGTTLNQLKGVKYCGPYNQSEIVSILNAANFDVMLLLSTVPETFSYTLSEAIQAQIPVIVSNIGALKERVEAQDIGWVVEYRDSETIATLLEKLHEDRNLLLEKKDKLKKAKLSTLEEMSTEYGNIIRTAIKGNTEILIEPWYFAEAIKAHSFRDYVFLDLADDIASQRISELALRYKKMRALMKITGYLMRSLDKVFRISRKIRNYIRKKG